MWPTTGKKCVFIHRNRDEMRNQISSGTLQHRKRNKRKEFRPLFVCSPIKCWRMLQRRSRQELSIEKETMPQNRQHNNQMNTRPCIKLNFFHSFVWFVAAVVFFYSICTLCNVLYGTLGNFSFTDVNYIHFRCWAHTVANGFMFDGQYNMDITCFIRTIPVALSLFTYTNWFNYGDGCFTFDSHFKRRDKYPKLRYSLWSVCTWYSTIYEYDGNEQQINHSKYHQTVNDEHVQKAVIQIKQRSKWLARTFVETIRKWVQ